MPAEIVPLALIRPISGSAGLSITTDLIATYGPDSFLGRLAAVMQGSTDTTFYVFDCLFRGGRHPKDGRRAEGRPVC
ncbi:hypothetical protein GCM10020331_068410 [Ectobacillus funiculus]